MIKNKLLLKTHPNCANNVHTTNSLTSLTNSSPKPSLGLVTNGANMACNVAKNNKRVKATTWVARREQMYLNKSEGHLKNKCLRPPHVHNIESWNITHSCKPILKFIDIPGTNHTFLTKSTSQALYSQVVGQNWLMLRFQGNQTSNYDQQIHNAYRHILRTKTNFLKYGAQGSMIYNSLERIFGFF